jgi:hypothetical protein
MLEWTDRLFSLDKRLTSGSSRPTPKRGAREEDGDNVRSMRDKLKLHTGLLLAAVLAGAGASSAQQTPDFNKVEIRTTRLAEDFYTLEGWAGR